MTDTSIEALERRVAEANAKVAEETARFFAAADGPPLGIAYVEMRRASEERTAALAALTAAKKPQPLTAEEACRIRYPHQPKHDQFKQCQLNGMQAVLDAAAERWLKVIEALPDHRDGLAITDKPEPLRSLCDIRTAMSKVKS